MSGQPASSSGSAVPRPTANGNTNGSMAMSMPAQHRNGDSQLGAGSNTQGGNMSQQNLNNIVRLYISYLQAYSMEIGIDYCLFNLLVYTSSSGRLVGKPPWMVNIGFGGDVVNEVFHKRGRRMEGREFSKDGLAFKWSMNT